MAKSRMFSIVTETWNPVTGCTHDCVYCWARRLVRTKLRNLERYKYGFNPAFHERELKRSFKPDGLVFVCDMGDLFCEGIPDSWIRRVVEHVERFPSTTFLFLTKNPARYMDFDFPPNAVLGATVETDRDDLAQLVSKAPPPSERFEAMKRLKWPCKVLSVEPILDFNPARFAMLIREVKPMLVYIGYDNYGCKLPEPPLSKTLRLIEELSRDLPVERKTLRKAWFERYRWNGKKHGC